MQALMQENRRNTKWRIAAFMLAVVSALPVIACGQRCDSRARSWCAIRWRSGP